MRIALLSVISVTLCLCHTVVSDKAGVSIDTPRYQVTIGKWPLVEVIKKQARDLDQQENGPRAKKSIRPRPPMFYYKPLSLNLNPSPQLEIVKSQSINRPVVLLKTIPMSTFNLAQNKPIALGSSFTPTYTLKPNPVIRTLNLGPRKIVLPPTTNARSFNIMSKYMGKLPHVPNPALPDFKLRKTSISLNLPFGGKPELKINNNDNHNGPMSEHVPWENGPAPWETGPPPKFSMNSPPPKFSMSSPPPQFSYGGMNSGSNYGFSSLQQQMSNLGGHMSGSHYDGNMMGAGGHSMTQSSPSGGFTPDGGPLLETVNTEFAGAIKYGPEPAPQQPPKIVIGAFPPQDYTIQQQERQIVKLQMPPMQEEFPILPHGFPNKGDWASKKSEIDPETGFLLDSRVVTAPEISLGNKNKHPFSGFRQMNRHRFTHKTNNVEGSSNVQESFADILSDRVGKGPIILRPLPMRFRPKNMAQRRTPSMLTRLMPSIFDKPMFNRRPNKNKPHFIPHQPKMNPINMLNNHMIKNMNHFRRVPLKQTQFQHNNNFNIQNNQPKVQWKKKEQNLPQVGAIITRTDLLQSPNISAPLGGISSLAFQTSLAEKRRQDAIRRRKNGSPLDTQVKLLGKLFSDLQDVKPTRLVKTLESDGGKGWGKVDAPIVAVDVQSYSVPEPNSRDPDILDSHRYFGFPGAQFEFGNTNELVNNVQKAMVRAKKVHLHEFGNTPTEILDGINDRITSFVSLTRRLHQNAHDKAENVASKGFKQYQVIVTQPGNGWAQPQEGDPKTFSHQAPLIFSGGVEALSG